MKECVLYIILVFYIIRDLLLIIFKLRSIILLEDFADNLIVFVANIEQDMIPRKKVWYELNLDPLLKINRHVSFQEPVDNK